MPKKYHIDVQATPNRYPVIGRSGIVDWGEGCLKCAQCVKYQCVYNVYRERSFSADILADTIDQFCKNCFRCVQGCPKRLIHKTLNPEWEALGDDTYTPEIISATWTQAETGKIPVSGAGYGGAFSGPGFDSMWTDMSEIVRPTRDGIHGREYISTVVEIANRPFNLEFGSDGNVRTGQWPFARISLPIMFDLPRFGALSEGVWRAMAMAAAEIDTMIVVPAEQVQALTEFSHHLVPVLDDDRIDGAMIGLHRMVQIRDGEHVIERATRLKAVKADLLVSVRIGAAGGQDLAARTAELTRAGVDLVHYAADERGYEAGVENGRHIKDVARNVHGVLVQEQLRDQATFMVSGGIAMAEHVIKSMLCGANLVAVDVPLLVALECRVCRNCVQGGRCPVRISSIDPRWGSRRIVNLMGAWHNQLLEMMGAMGIREARRLRGEQGRVMFIEDLERDTFAQLLGNRNS